MHGDYFGFGVSSEAIYLLVGAVGMFGLAFFTLFVGAAWMADLWVDRTLTHAEVRPRPIDAPVLRVRLRNPRLDHRAQETDDPDPHFFI